MRPGLYNTTAGDARLLLCSQRHEWSWQSHTLSVPFYGCPRRRGCHVSFANLKLASTSCHRAKASVWPTESLLQTSSTVRFSGSRLVQCQAGNATPPWTVLFDLRERESAWTPANQVGDTVQGPWWTCFGCGCGGEMGLDFHWA
jgi:hypothetical protein